MKLLIAALAVGILAQAPTARAEGDVKKGKVVYQSACILCHGEKYDGQGDAGKYLKPLPRNLVSDPFKAGDKLENIVATVKNGLAGTGMAGFAASLTADQIQDVAAFVKSLRK